MTDELTIVLRIWGSGPWTFAMARIDTMSCGYNRCTYEPAILTKRSLLESEAYRIPEPESSFNLQFWRLDHDKRVFQHFEGLVLRGLDIRLFRVSFRHALIERDGGIDIDFCKNTKPGVDFALER